MHHPWRHLRSLPHIRLTWARLADDVLGVTDGHSRIWLDDRQLQVERRCTLAHELAHIELGHRDGCTGVEEVHASRLAARRLIRLDHLAEALAWSEHPAEVADVLWVDVDTLRTRLAHLHPAERHHIATRLARKETAC